MVAAYRKSVLFLPRGEQSRAFFCMLPLKLQVKRIHMDAFDDEILAKMRALVHPSVGGSVGDICADCAPTQPLRNVHRAQIDSLFSFEMNGRSAVLVDTVFHRLI